MWRRKTRFPTLKIRVSHEVSRLEQQCMAEAFERLLPILERRLRPEPDERAAPRETMPDPAGITRRISA